MTAAEDNEHTCSPSTSWTWKHVIIDPPPAAPTRTAPKGPRRPRLSSWNRRTPLTIQVKYRGGPEGWVELKARGRVYRATGDLGILDVLVEIWEGK